MVFMSYTLLNIILSIGISLSIDCYEQGVCDDGYVDITDGDTNYWACGSDCEGGTYYTDNGCNCACIEDINGNGCFYDFNGSIITSSPSLAFFM